MFPNFAIWGSSYCHTDNAELAELFEEAYKNEFDPGGESTIEKIRELVRRGLNVNSATIAGWQLLEKACQLDLFKVVEYLIPLSDESNIRKGLNRACRIGSLTCVKVFMAANVALNGHGRYPLEKAAHAENNRLELSELLIEHKAELEKNDGFTALQWACKSGDETLVRLLVGKKANIQIESCSPLWLACSEAKTDAHFRIIQYLLELGANTTYTGGGSSVFSFGERKLVHQREITKLLVDHKADPNAVLARGESVLMQSFGSGCSIPNPEKISALLEVGADPVALNEEGNTLLMNLARRNSYKSFSLEDEIAVSIALFLECIAEQEAQDSIP